VLASLKGGNYQIDAPIKGASLTIQSAPSISIADLEAHNFSNASIPVCLSAPSWLVGPSDPLVQAHITRLYNGIAVALAMHHVLGDARATFTFLGAWAECSRVGALVSVRPPVIDRTNLMPLPKTTIRRHDEFKIVPPIASDAAPATATPFVLPTIATEYLHFTSESLARLKQDAIDSMPDSAREHGSWVSMNDALTALLWRVYTRSRGLYRGEWRGEERGGEIPTVCSFACDCRSRLEPPLPDSYFGNVNFLVYTSTTVAALLDGSLGETAISIRNATERNNNEHVRSALAYIEAAGDKSTVKLSPSYFLGNDIILSNWSKFPLLENDWGFGKPCAVRIPSSKLDGFCLFLPAQDGGVDVLAGLRAEHWSNLLLDPELLAYSTPPPTGTTTIASTP
jgi:shikimate O-hydroxycinnamoyltransferase